MLTDLLIKNYALIEQLKMKPHESLNIITGETGAGKSIMLGAIGLLLGNRADLKTLLNKDEKCIVEASFLVWAYKLKDLFEDLDIDYEDETTIRREISPSGKSRAFINDTPVNLDTLKRLGAYLIDVHSQHDTLQLSDNIYQLKIIDAYAQNEKILEKYQAIYKTFSQVRKEYERLQNDFASAQKEHEYNSFLLKELQQADFKANEQESLEKESQLLDKAEEVKQKFAEALSFLEHSEPAANDELKTIVSSLAQIAELSESYTEIYERLQSCIIELQDITKDIEREEEAIESDQERIEQVQDRLGLLYNLQQKHQVANIEELLRVQAEIEAKVNKVLNFDEELQKLKVKLEQSEEKLLSKAEKLSKSRQAVIPSIEDELKIHLADLGMPNATIKIDREKIKPDLRGNDNIKILFSANKGIAPEDISKVASGGEFSRLMLAIKYILAGKTAMPTIIFDEIDTGISGEIAMKMGEMFKKMTEKHQIIAISHLHQIAAKGHHHYFVYKDDSKDRTVSRIRHLVEEERITEIAKMISGTTEPSPMAIESAKELLEV